MMKDDYSVAGQNEKSSASLPMTEFESGAYVHHLDGLDITDAQKLKLERIVWDIVRMSFEMNLPPELCGQIVETILDPADDESGTVE